MVQKWRKAGKANKAEFQRQKAKWESDHPGESKKGNKKGDKRKREDATPLSKKKRVEEIEGFVSAAMKENKKKLKKEEKMIQAVQDAINQASGSRNTAQAGVSAAALMKTIRKGFSSSKTDESDDDSDGSS